MKHILFFIPTLSNGGAERVLCNLVNRLCDIDGFDVSVLTLFKDDRNKLSNKVYYAYVFSWKFRGNVHLLKLFPATWLYNWMIGNRGKYDIVVSYLQSPTMRIVGGCRDSSVNTVNWIHFGFKTLDGLKKYYRNKKEFVSSILSYSSTVFVSQSAKVDLLNMLPDLASKDCRVIYNINDFKEIRKKSNELVKEDCFNTNAIKIISAGRFTSQKSFDRLIRIIAKLNSEGIVADLFLLGKGSLQDYYLKISEKMNIFDKVHLLGYQSNPFKYYKLADIFVCSSIQEGYSTALTEALVVGLPVITTDCAGMHELLGQNEYGIITDNNENALYGAIKKVVTEESILIYYKSQSMKRGMELAESDNLKPVIDLFEELFIK